MLQNISNQEQSEDQAITVALRDIAQFLDKHSELHIDSAQIKSYLSDPERFSFPLHFREDRELSDHQADYSFRELREAFSSELRQQVLREKWNTPERARNLNYFLDALNQPGEHHDVLTVNDLSSARSIESGRFVHRLTLSLPDQEQMTLFAKGHGLPENSPLLKFPGWENRPRMHLYETFFWQAASLAGLVERGAGFFPERSDPCCIGYTLIEHIPGESSDHLLEERNGTMVIRPEFWRTLPVLLTQLARWSAFNEVFRGGDRRTVHLNPDYHRPTNYLIAFRDTAPLITGIDHELLFCADPCVTYDRLHKAHEAAVIEALPKEARAFGRDIFSRVFIAAWKEYTRPELLDCLRTEIARHFGSASEESKIFESSIRRHPRDILGELFGMGHREASVILSEVPGSPADSPEPGHVSSQAFNVSSFELSPFVITENTL